MANAKLQAFTINFGTGLCGLEILFDEKKREFTVGKVFADNSPTAARYEEVLPGAIITSLNEQPTTGLTSMPEIQAMFTQAAKTNKMVSFKTMMPPNQVSKLEKLCAESEALITKVNPMHYYATLPRRPLGFTVAATPGNNRVEICQVDSVHEEDIQLGSELVTINGTAVKNLKQAIGLLRDGVITPKSPLRLLLQRRDVIFENDQEEKDAVPGAAWTLQSWPKDEEVQLEVAFLNKDYKQAHGSWAQPIGKNCSVSVLRAKIAALTGLKYAALRIIAKGKHVKDDMLKIHEVVNMKTPNVIVVVSEKEQEKKEVNTAVDYRSRMRIMGAFFKTVDPETYNYLWRDIDHENKKLLHITELDRLLARLTGVYERAMSHKPVMEYEFVSVDFSTKRNLGLVIEGNEVIMCHNKSQAQEQGIQAAWKVVGAEYFHEKAKKKIKLTVDHKSCLQSLKRAKTECSDAGFKVLCQKPSGRRYELQILMKKQAIADLKLDDGTQTLTLDHYNKLPDVFANAANGGAYRVAINEAPVGINLVGHKDAVKGVPGGFVEGLDAKVHDFVKASVKKGDRLIGIGNDDLAGLAFDKVNDKAKAAAKRYPVILTFDRSEDYNEPWMVSAADKDDEKEN